jgi:CRP-like cAMP-binding protein
VTTIRSGGIFNPGEDGWAGVDETVSTAVARKNVICSLPRDAFTVAVDGCPLASRLLREYEGALIRELGGLTSDRLHRQPEVRIRHTLWRDTRDAPDRAAAYTHEELACRATTDRPRVTRVITKLIRDGIIEIEREEHRIIVRDPDWLAEHE